MTIYEMQRNFMEDASLLGDYKNMSKLELANGYCDAEEAGDEQLRSAYHSALMLRYWYKIWEWQRNSASLRLEPTDFVDWLVDSLWVAFYYREWRFEYKAIVKHGKFLSWKLDEEGNKILNPYYYKLDPNAPDKIINRCCMSIRGKEYQYHNKMNRKANVHTYSLDNMIDEEGDYAINNSGCITYDKKVYDNPVYLLVNAFYERKEWLEGLIIDGMSNPASFKDIKTKTTEELYDEDLGEYSETEIEKHSNIFNPRSLVKYLVNLDKKAINNYCINYDIPQIYTTLIYNKLKATTNTNLYKLIKKVQIEVRENEELKSLIA